GASRVGHPDLALVGVAEQGGGGAVQDDLGPVARHGVVENRVVALGDAVLGAVGERHLPEVVLLVVLIVGEDVVLLPFFVALLLGLGLLRYEVDRVARRRPGDRSGRRGMVSQLAGFAAGVGDEVDLCHVAVARRDEGDHAPVGRPAGFALAA